MIASLKERIKTRERLTGERDVISRRRLNDMLQGIRADLPEKKKTTARSESSRRRTRSPRRRRSKVACTNDVVQDFRRVVDLMDMELHQARSRGADMSAHERVNMFRRIVKTGIQRFVRGLGSLEQQYDGLRRVFDGFQCINAPMNAPDKKLVGLDMREKIEVMSDLIFNNLTLRRNGRVRLNIKATLK